MLEAKGRQFLLLLLKCMSVLASARLLNDDMVETELGCSEIADAVMSVVKKCVKV
jgi:hypothetical protein